MKKTLKLFGLAALVAIAFSCTKKDDPFIPGTPTDQTTPNEGQTEEPAVIPATDGGVLTSFGATVDSEATKVTVDLSDGETKGKTTIKDGDEVRVVDSEGHSSAIYVYDESQSKFVLKKGETAVTVKTTGVTGVYYPESEYDVMKDGTVQLALPAGIADDGDDDVADFGAAFGAINPMAGVITGDKTNGYSVTLNNIVSALRVKVSAEVNINSVTLDFGSDNKYAGAKFTVDPSTFTDPSTFADPSTSALTYVEGSGSASYESVELDTPALTADVLFLLPTVELTDGLTLTVTANLDGNHNGGASTFSVSKDKYIPVKNRISTMSFYARLFSGGKGTTTDPYIIATAKDFKYISKYCKEGYKAGSLTIIPDSDFLKASYKQTKDIDFKKGDLSGYMIASPSAAFSGTYDGNDKTLSNYSITHTPTQGDQDGAALFQNVDGGVLQNISISGATVTGGKFTAGLVGYAKGDGATIQNCSIESSTISDSGNDFGAAGLIGGIYGGTVTGCSGKDLTISTSVANKLYFGGLITYINGNVTVSECELNGTTTVTNAQKFGGIIGQINNVNVTITNCHNHSTINGSKNYNGGICGYAKLGTISNCTNDGAVNGFSSTAGIVAQLDGATVDHCTNSGTIHGSENYAAGIVAYHTKGNLTNSVNAGEISADGAFVGGIAGMLKSSAAYGLIKGCRSNASVTGSNDVAGIVGRVTFGIVMDCFAKGTATGGLNTGGIVGYAYSSDGHVAVMNCLSNVAVTCNASGNQHSGGVIGRATCVDAKYVYIGNCAGLNNVVKATQSNAIRFGAFTGFTNAEKDSAKKTYPDRVRIWNSYTLVDESNFQCANTGATAEVGGFVGRMGAASDLGDCYYIIDGSKSTLNGSTYKNITKTTAEIIGGTGTIAVNPTRQGLNLDDTFLNVLNRCTYASNGTTRLTAFNDYPMCNWTMTGANSEALSHPVPANLVALGPDFYE